MNVFVIPSWYPSESYPSTGIFFREQTRILARLRPGWQIGLSLWGSHEPKLWLKASHPLDSLIRLSSKMPMKPFDQILLKNCVEFFTPTYTWTRRVSQGNIQGILSANKQNFERFSEYYGKPDLIHAHVAYPAGRIAQHLSSEYRIPYVITEHMSPFPMSSFKGDYRKLLLPPMQKANKVLAVSQALVNRLNTFGVEAQVVSNFIDDDFFKPNDRKTTGKLQLVAIGRLEPQKNYQSLFEVLQLLKKRVTDFEISIIGAGSQEQLLKRKSQQLGVFNQINWFGERDQEFIRDSLNKADLLINTSLHENQPVAILEALACGVPVISMCWDGAEELIRPGLGQVVNSIQQMADVIRDFSYGDYSATEVRSIYEEHWGASRSVDRLESIYKSLL